LVGLVGLALWLVSGIALNTHRFFPVINGLSQFAVDCFSEYYTALRNKISLKAAIGKINILCCLPHRAC